MTTFFKQYGEMRTGTNYLKRLLEINFKDVEVFGSILGWKHGLYDLENNLDDTTSHVDWVHKKTKNNVVYSVDNLPLIKHDKQYLLDACESLNYIFSIKKPIPFVLSFKKFRMPNKKLNRQVITTLCERYNNKYKKWLQLYEKHGGMFVAHESVLMDYKHVLFNIETKYNLKRKNSKLIDETKTVKASTDIGLIVDRSDNFDKNYYLHERYLDDINEQDVDMIMSTINHDLIEYIYKLSV